MIMQEKHHFIPPCPCANYLEFMLWKEDKTKEKVSAFLLIFFVGCLHTNMSQYYAMFDFTKIWLWVKVPNKFSC